MPKFIDYTGKKIGRVLINKLLGMKNKRSFWNCSCDCGKEFNSNTYRFKKGHLFECKPCTYSRKTVDLTGKVFSRWTVLCKAAPDKRGKTQWSCKCECGTLRIVADSSLKRPRHSMSCGCLGRKLKSRWVNPSLYPKQSLLSVSEKKFYSMRTQLIHKCYKPKNSMYFKFGQKGITVCDLWRNDARAMFEWAQSNSWKESDSIILKKGEKEFNPENCFILSESETRSLIGKEFGNFVILKGKRKNLKNWAKEKNICRTTITRRKKLGMDIENAINTPRQTHKLKLLNHEEKSLIKSQYLRGDSLEEIGKKLNVSGSAISYFLEKEGFEKRHPSDRSGFSNEQLQEQLRNGLNPSEISRKFGVTPTCIYTRIKLINGIKRKR